MSFAYKCGAIYSNVDVRDYKLVCARSNYEFPDEFSLGVVRIKNQESTGSCCAHAISSAIEYYNSTQMGDTTEMSVGYIYGNRTNSAHKGPGMIIREALDIVRNYGDVPKSEFPYNEEMPFAMKLYEEKANELYGIGRPYRFSEYCRIDTVGAAKLAIISGRPLVMAMDWYEDMVVNENGVLETKYTGYAGGHCMLAYGWNEDGWLIQNSWGEDWGINGCFVLPYEMGMAECWAVMDDIIEGAHIKKPFSSKAGKILAKIINRICNLFRRS